MVSPRRPKLRVVETPLVAAVNETVRSLEATGRLESIDAAEVAVVRMLAADIDSLPADARSKPQLVRQMTLVLRSLRGTTRDDHDLDDLLARLATSSESAMGDAAL